MHFNGVASRLTCRARNYYTIFGANATKAKYIRCLPLQNVGVHVPLKSTRAHTHTHSGKEPTGYAKVYPPHCGSLTLDLDTLNDF